MYYVMHSMPLDFNLSEVGHSNVAHTNEESNLICRARLDAQERLVGLNAEIAASQLRLQELEAQRQKIERDIARYDVALAPHKMLPEDVLRWIFTLCADEEIYVEPFRCLKEETSSFEIDDDDDDDNDDDDDDDDEGSTSRENLVNKAREWVDKAEQPQFVLLKVCRAWRQVAAATPELWSSVQVHTIDVLTLLVAKWIFGFSDTLKSLSLYLSRLNLTDGPTFPLFTHHRYKKLELYLHSTIVPQVALIPREAVSELKELCLRIGTEYMHGPGLESLHLCSHQFPLVSKLELEMTCDPPLHITLPYGQLRHLDLSDFPLQLLQCLDILHQSPCLEDAEFKIYPSNTHNILPEMQEYINTSLRKLYIRFIDGAESLKMCRLLRLHNLTKLTISAGYPLHWTAETYHLLNQNFNFSKLETLELGETRNPIDVGLLLQKAHSLESLELPETVVFSVETMNGLSTGQLGPRLHRLTACVDLDKEMVLSMVESRWKYSVAPTGECSANGARPTPLRVVWLFRDDDIDMPENIMKRQRELEQLGIHVTAWDWDEW
ncbi:hypothetical protein AMATHDRAFT_84681 [Amanita thiersii Skay4041]|uniref:F-box domain-containing protein n=1 Tax=Amanita thiersii Skay4041 TaxID=703135 RepID=A0A2A9NMD5_9AGAR|nr:hypothetical protein AMATHDRAFT_84681 [Amanita thiersii Skay4041]